VRAVYLAGAIGSMPLRRAMATASVRLRVQWAGVLRHDVDPARHAHRLGVAQALYPDVTGPTGVQIQPNAPITASDPLTTSIMAPPRQVSWNSAPAVVTGSGGLGESASQGHWHNWDVTNLVQQWVNDSRLNNGVTLVNEGALVASPRRWGPPRASRTRRPTWTSSTGRARPSTRGTSPGARPLPRHSACHLTSPAHASRPG
jgi:hypothetical protein